MTITRQTHVADIALAVPSAIRIFQDRQIDFCCGGRVPLADACAERGLDTNLVLAEIESTASIDDHGTDWTAALSSTLIAHIQRRYHERLRRDLPRLDAMLDKLISRHGDRLASTLLSLQTTFRRFSADLFAHMLKEDTVLFPAILALDAAASDDDVRRTAELQAPISCMEAEHADAGEALDRMRALTGGYVPPSDACPTFRGLYAGLIELERDMHVHVHLENNVLFPRYQRP